MIALAILCTLSGAALASCLAVAIARPKRPTVIRKLPRIKCDSCGAGKFTRLDLYPHHCAKLRCWNCGSIQLAHHSRGIKINHRN